MAINKPSAALSANDTRILNALFDPETLPSSVARSQDAAAIDPLLPAHPTIPAASLSQLDARQHEIVKHMSIRSDTAGIDSAIAELNDTISRWPTYSSARVNRAMLRRLRIESTLQDNDNIFSAHGPAIDDLFGDLAQAVRLSLPTPSPSAQVSPHQARILRTAYSHRAFLYLKAVETETALDGLSKTELEELASRDFAAAARYGDEVAREMSVRTNPYAKMCGAIVRNALAEERKGNVSQEI